jgi:hypothetical protein
VDDDPPVGSDERPDLADARPILGDEPNLRRRGDRGAHRLADHW